MTLVVAYCTSGGSELHKYKKSEANFTIEYKNNTAYNTYAFLYGTIPTAPTVLVYASKYNYGEQVVNK
jgi:hypothetical protein